MKSGAPDEIEYRGEKIRLSKPYADYDDYKNDPDNIAPAETARVQKLVTEAPIERGPFADRLAIAKAVTAITFPGYGTGSLLSDAEGVLVGFSIEIPRADQDRHLTFRRGAGGYVLIDDFISAMPLVRVVEANGELVYGTRENERAVTRPIASR